MINYAKSIHVTLILDCGKNFACISTTNSLEQRPFLTTQVDYLTYYYYPTIDHNFPLFLKDVADHKKIEARPEFKWTFKCKSCRLMKDCQILLRQKRSYIK